MSQEELLPQSYFSFGPRFLHDHAGHIITDPRIAVVELVANSYDAGASKVDIVWPEQSGRRFSVTDDGTGMTSDQFNHRWRTLAYSRPQEQGVLVEYPPGVSGPKRLAFGQNGKGRYSPFCFSDEYQVDTWRDGTCVRVGVSLTEGGIEPFHCELLGTSDRTGHGTSVGSVIVRNALPVSSVREAVGSKFLVDPNFAVWVNGEPLELMSLSGLETQTLEVPPFGSIAVHQIDALVQDRTTLLRGITWWVNRRMVGIPSWDGLDGAGAILDGRTTLAKRCSFIVEADLLMADVRADWTGLHDSSRTVAAKQVVHDYVQKRLADALSETRKERKRDALERAKGSLTRLPSSSRRLVGEFVDKVQLECPTLSPADLARAADIFATMEVARSGYALLEKLAACSPSDLDTWNSLMDEWSADNAAVVLSELGRRLQLIEQLEELVLQTNSDELHDLQPLFGKGLWMFGPEYESIDFTSNRTMGTVIGELLGGSLEVLSARRPDFVVLPERSVCCYASDGFDESGEVDNVRKVLVIELKRGGFTLGTDELYQGEKYALELRSASLVTDATDIVVCVIGTSIDSRARDDRVLGSIRVKPMTYEIVLKRAHARTFNLQRRLVETQPRLPVDEDVEDLLGTVESAVPTLSVAAARGQGVG